MANFKQMKDEALSTVDSALAILNKFPDIDTTNTSLSYNVSSNPFELLMDLFKTTCGYNVMIKIISNMIVAFLPPLEIAVKGVLLSNIKNLLSCSINPIISDDLLKNGICFNLEQIDISDTLKYSPTDKFGQYFYFDNKNVDDKGNAFFKISDELKNSKDFNCLLWFMKNRASHREVWAKKVTTNGSFTEESDYWNVGGDNGRGKCRKGAGILTLEFSENSSSLRDAVGDPYYIQTPYNNILHVFLGNVQETEEQFITYDKDLNENNKLIQSCKERLDLVFKDLNDLHERSRATQKLLKEGKITVDTYNNTYIGEDIFQQAYYIRDRIKQNSFKFDVLEEELKKLQISQDSELYNLLDEAINIVSEIDGYVTDNNKIYSEQSKLTRNYRPIEKNYYYKHTLVEFNTDYIMSLKLFDSKVVAAQLIDSLTGVLNINLDLSFKQVLIKNEIEKMCRMIIETNDSTVSDCFFTFTNDDYNAMLEKAELNRMDLFSINGETNSNIEIDPDKLMASLNELSPDATQVSDITVIEHALTEISGMVSEEVDESSSKPELNFGVQMNFIEKLMTYLAVVIARAVLSPKLFLLMLINLEILGRDTNFSLEAFIDRFKGLIVELLRTISDLIVEELNNQLMGLLKDVAKEISVKIAVEQAEYYHRLIKKLIDCFKKNGSSLDFNIDNVNYADILSEENNDPNKEC